MKKYVLLVMVGLLSVSCNAQHKDVDKTPTKKSKENVVKEPKGSWKVDKEFDEHGNLIRYDSIYSWSSHDKFNDLSDLNRDSLMQSYKSRFFTNFSRFENEGFEDIFSQDSLFSERFFNDDFFESSFGKDFRDLDRIRQQMIDKQKKFLEKYQSEFIKHQEKTK